MNKIVGDVCRDLSSPYLTEYLKRVAKYYDKADFLYASLIAKKTAEDVEKLVKFVKKTRDLLVKRGSHVDVAMSAGIVSRSAEGFRDRCWRRVLKNPNI